MELALNQNLNLDLASRIKEAIKNFKIMKLEEMMSSALESMPEKSYIDYIGELNKNDVMH